MKTKMEMNKKLFALVCLLWTNLLFVSSQGLYRQSQSQQVGNEQVASGREEIGGFLFESKSTLTEKPTTLPGDVGTPVGDGYLILLALIGGYTVYRTGRIPFALLPGLLRCKRLAMTDREHRHCESDSLKQSREFANERIYR
ncbi:MAG: hypothetical protein LBM08_11280 [Dysgonamonadaceae bacterium]|jgi:hypothetical protein|nr:hypothetical protein [Dysgonamonadaceae bacterium]